MHITINERNNQPDEEEGWWEWQPQLQDADYIDVPKEAPVRYDSLVGTEALAKNSKLCTHSRR